MINPAGGLSVVEILVVMVASFVLVGLFSFLEVVWLTVYDDDVVSHESHHGGIHDHSLMRIF